MSKPLSKDVPVGDYWSLLLPVPSKEVLSKMARTEAEIERIKKEAFESGYEAGWQSGKKEGIDAGREQGLGEGFKAAHDEADERLRPKFENLHHELERMTQKVNPAISEWFEKSEPGLAQLAALIAQRVVAKELATSHEALVALTKEAISEVTHATHARIKVHPFDSQTLEKHRSEILSAAHSVRDLEIVDDDEILGGCVIETDGGVVDATIDMKFAELLAAIRSAA